tara:strand:- start:863 stop:979 length:117 start_codon:yes stop_codon:yes gene_type:complete
MNASRHVVIGGTPEPMKNPNWGRRFKLCDAIPDFGVMW